MKTNNPILLLSKGYIFISGLALLYVSLMALASPQAVMDLVQVELTTTDAFSSIRGVYGGVGLAIFISLMYMIKRHTIQAILFLAIFWGLYGTSRIITILVEGELGSFGNQWLLIEGFFCLLAIGLYLATKKHAFSNRAFISKDYKVPLKKVH